MLVKKRKEMNCTEANKTPITYILKQFYGIDPVKQNTKRIFYKSPFRQESQASFTVSEDRNNWKDWGTGESGTAIDLICILSNVDVSGALAILQGVKVPTNYFSFDKQKHEDSFKLEFIQPIQNLALIKYLKSRGISYHTANITPQLKEGYWEHNNRLQFALAFKNDENGFELRSKYHKLATSPKAITTIPGINKNLNLFEGFFDYLSAKQLFKTQSNNTIVLNSLSNIEKVNLKKYETINLYLDNDKPGIKAARDIIKTHPNATNRSQQRYPNHSDFNEYLLSL